MDATAAMTPERKAAHVGTHVIQEVAYGGYLSASALVSMCVLNSLTIAEVEAEVSFAAVELSTSGKYTSSCSVFNSYATFESLVGGGDKSTLSVQTNRDDAALKAWVNTLQVSPTTTKKLLVDLGSIIPEFGPSIDEYVAIETVQQQDQVAPETCPDDLSCASAKQSNSSESEGKNGIMASGPVVAVIAGVAVLVFVAVIALVGLRWKTRASSCTNVRIRNTGDKS